MKRWINIKFNSGLANALVISGSFFGLAVCFALYLVWFQGMELIFGIPAQLLMATIILPVVLAGMLFRHARKLERLDRLRDDAKSH